MSAATTPRTLPPRESTINLDASRRAQAAWSRVPVSRRLRIIRDARHRIAEQTAELAAAVKLPQRTSRAETLAAEILPLADACRFLEREAETLLAVRRLGRRGRPFWLGGSQVELHREPFGVVLIVAPSNYPLLLPGVQAAQALVAGNAVLWKPGHGGAEAAAELARLFCDAGLPENLLTVLDETPAAAQSAINAGVDKVLLTGSTESGRAVLGQLAASATPAVMELSGCEAVFVREDADLDLVARALRFGLTFNASFTCIAPRRVFVARRRHEELERRLVEELGSVAPMPVAQDSALELLRLARAALAGGARRVCGTLPEDRPWQDSRLAPLVLADVRPEMEILRADVAAPVLSLVAVDGDDQALELARRCRFELGATVFGEPRGARALAERVAAGVVVINDLIVPTADPRVPFGGRRASGFGITRGAEGLLELTQVKAMILRRGRFRPHFDPPDANQERLLSAFVQVAHGKSMYHRFQAVLEIARAVVSTRTRIAPPGRSER